MKLLIGKNGCYFTKTTNNFKIAGIFRNPHNGYIELFGLPGNQYHGIYAAKKFLQNRLQKLILVVVSNPSGGAIDFSYFEGSSDGGDDEGGEISDGCDLPEMSLYVTALGEVLYNSNEEFSG